MDILFNELYNNIIKEENINEEICNICHYKTLNDKIILSCKHVFHNKCIKNLKKCPYCFKIIEKNKNIITTCKIILKSGKNKGKECGRINCKIHKNISIENINKDICSQVLKSGKIKKNVVITVVFTIKIII